MPGFIVLDCLISVTMSQLRDQGQDIQMCDVSLGDIINSDTSRKLIRAYLAPVRKESTEDIPSFITIDSFQYAQT